MTAVAVRKLVKSAAFAVAAGTVTHVFQFRSWRTPATDPCSGCRWRFETAGTYNGAMGTYKVYYFWTARSPLVGDGR